MPTYNRPTLTISNEELTTNCQFHLLNLTNNQIFNSLKAGSNHIFFCMEGEVQILYTGNNATLQEGRFLLVTHLTNWKGKALSNARMIIHTFDYTIYHFDKAILYPSFLYGKKLTQEPGDIARTLLIKQSLNLLLFSIEAYLNDNTGNSFIWEIKHQEMYYLFTKYYELSDLYVFFRTLYIDFVSFKCIVLANADGVKDCGELAKCCGYSIKTFRKVFKQEFKKPVLQWLQERKAMKVKTRITSPEIIFKDIIYEFDFTSASHFNKFCKKHLGETPTDLRGKYTKDYSI